MNFQKEINCVVGEGIGAAAAAATTETRDVLSMYAFIPPESSFQETPQVSIFLGHSDPCGFFFVWSHHASPKSKNQLCFFVVVFDLKAVAQ